MDGKTTAEQVLNYLARLTGGELVASAPIQLRSIHRAAFASWAGTQGIILRRELLNDSNPFLIRDILAHTAEDSRVETPPVATQTHPTATELQPFRVGIDIEEVDAMPLAADYREDSFYQENFTSAELVHCLRQADPRASFCGVWAAKEAILKSGALPLATPPYAVEITWDDRGRPQFPQCSLSISHTPHTAVAVCIRTPTGSSLAEAARCAGQGRDAALQPSDVPLIRRRFWFRSKLVE